MVGNNKKKALVRTLTVYLLRDVPWTVETIIPEHKKLKRFAVGEDADAVGTLLVKRSSLKTPRWAGLFAEHVPLGDLGKVSSSSAALLVSESDRWFALTFGTGRSLLADDSWEERFGLRVALNSIKEDSIKSVDRLRFDAVASHARTQSTRKARVSEFGLDVEQDLLRAVTGTPTKEEWGLRMTGMDGLHVEVRVEVPGLRALLREYLDQSRSKKYRQRFPWVDQIAEVKSGELEDTLTVLACEKINSQSPDAWLSVPEIVDWTAITGFRFTGGGADEERTDVSVADFLAYLDGEAATVSRLKSHRVVAVDGNGLSSTAWSVFKCLYAEVEYKDQMFALTAGSWYRIDKAFAAAVNDDVEKIEEFPAALPEFEHSTEGKYCQMVANNATDSFALMDQKLISFGTGKMRIEFCDLYSNARDIIHVKRYGASGVLSHLLAQGAVSAEAFKEDLQFRKDALALLPALFHWSEPVEAHDFRVVFAVVSAQENKLRLPFFTRVNLRQVTKRLRNYGYRIAIGKIAMEEAFIKKQKAKKSQKKS